MASFVSICDAVCLCLVVIGAHPYVNSVGYVLSCSSRKWSCVRNEMQHVNAVCGPSLIGGIPTITAVILDRTASFLDLTSLCFMLSTEH
jgi:hypothetical protein